MYELTLRFISKDEFVNACKYIKEALESNNQRTNEVYLVQFFCETDDGIVTSSKWENDVTQPDIEPNMDEGKQ